MNYHRAHIVCRLGFNHGLVKLAKEWKYSTFEKYVKSGLYDENWCDFNEDSGVKIYE